jgi:hypothetical protein
LRSKQVGALFKETNVSVRPEDFNLKIVDISGVMPKHATARYSKRNSGEWTIRKIVIHHHGSDAYPMPTWGTYKTSSKKKQGGKWVDVETVHDWKFPNGMPRAYIGAASHHVAQDWEGYSYHYDVPYYAETNGSLDVVYQTQDLTKVSAHAIGGNHFGVAISMLGTNRTDGQNYALGTPGLSQAGLARLQEDYDPKPVADEMGSPTEGLPSPFQQRAVRNLVRYLQAKYGISSRHVEGHFIYNKSTCPGYDFERWIMDYQDRDRRFCYPVRLGGSGTPFLKTGVQEGFSDFFKYLENPLKKDGHGYFPCGRRHMWHNGVHLFPPPADGANPVFAVRDGWVVAARFNGQVTRTETIEKNGTKEELERNYGSNCFVLVRHCDPGVRNAKEKRSLTTVKSKKGDYYLVRPLEYFSLYMHTQPLDESIGWVKELKKRDLALYNKVRSSDKPWVFTDLEIGPRGGADEINLSLPVKTGEIIGKVGMHDPFPMRRDGKSALVPVLHFEMFSSIHLLRWFDPDEEAYKLWTLEDKDGDPLMDDNRLTPQKLKGMTEEVARRLKEAIEKADKEDPDFEKADLVPHHDVELHRVLSSVITQHISEAAADWGKVLNNTKWRDKYKVTRQQVTHHREVVEQFQWMRQLQTAIKGDNAAEADRKNNLKRLIGSGLNPATAYFYYHPIRLLHWLNGMVREFQGPAMPHFFDRLNPYDLTVTAAEASKKDDKTIVLKYLSPTNSNNKVIGKFGLPEKYLRKNKKIKWKGKTYTITDVEAVSDDSGGKRNRKVTLDRPLEHAIGKGAVMKLGDFVQGKAWRWNRKFFWANPVMQGAFLPGDTQAA